MCQKKGVNLIFLMTEKETILDAAMTQTGNIDVSGDLLGYFILYA